jgi:hypothetical protein
MPDGRWGCGVSRRLLWIGALCAMALAPGACAARLSEEPLVVPYSLRKLGVGSQAVRGGLILEEGTERAIVSNSLIEALQSFQLSIVEPRLRPDEHLLPGQRWTTDTVAISQATIDEHNRVAPLMRLESDRYYGIQFIGEYAIDRDNMRFTVHAVLHERGALSNFKRYRSDAYSGQFFVNQLKQAIREALDQSVKQRK